ncbi:MAG: sterol desaturase family protein [Pseudomonadota bacterium]
MTLEGFQQFASAFDEVFFLIGIAILGIEVVRGLATKAYRWRGFQDMLVNVSTQIPFLAVEILILSFAYAGYSVLSTTYVGWVVPMSIGTALLAVLACDFVYYWEHRFAHQIRLFWTQHAVHHSSRFMNITVGVRFGPLEGLLSLLAHLPLVFVGFPPKAIFVGILIVQAYQTWIHTELIGKLGPVDGILNTPANHRVHHGCDEKYTDKNYGGILIIWDRMFGTYQAEVERPRYGLKRDFNSVNPFKVWISELPQFWRDIKNADTFIELWMTIFGPPGWSPKKNSARTGSPHIPAE